MVRDESTQSRGTGAWVWFLVVAALVCSGAAAVPQPVRHELGDPIFHAVGDSRSIPDKDVTALAQDQAGFLWIGTHDGAVRHDGYTFRLFRHDAADPRSLVGNRIRVIRGARDGRIWLGTDDSGISIFDPATETFVNLTAARGGIASNNVRDFAEEADGSMWVSSAGGLDLIDAKSLTVTHVDPQPSGFRAPDRSRLGALLLDRRGDLWIGSAAGLAVRRKSGAVEVIAGSPSDGIGLIGRPVYRLYEARDGAIWAGIFGGGVVRVDPGLGTARLIEEGGAARAYGFCQIDSATIWLGTPAEGIEIRDASSGSLLARYRHDASVPESIASNRIASLLVDRSGIVWIGTTGSGLVRYNPADGGFRLLRHSPLRPDGLTCGEVESVFESSDGLLWVGTHANGADVFDATRRVAGYRAGPADGRFLDHPRVGAITETADGAIWMGTSGAVNRLDRTLDRIEQIPAQGFGRTTGRISVLVPARDATGLWVGSTSGLAYLDTRTRLCRPAEFEDGKPVTGLITDIVQREDVMWVAGAAGLAVLPAGATRFRRFTQQENTEGTLSPGSPIDLLSDSKGRLWVGMSSGLLRLERFDGRSARFLSFSSKLGLAGERCDNLLEDEQGRIWIEDALTFDPETLSRRTFGLDEGAGRSIWQRAAVKTRSGQLVLGGPDGLLFIDPPGLREWSYSPPVVLTSLRIDGKRIPAHGLSRLLLIPGNETVAFEFAALDLSAPSRNRYRYRLEGFDREWKEADASQRSATYTSLPPGTYVLEIQGSNREGVWGLVSFTLPVEVRPALYQTLPFRLGAALLLVGLTWPVYRIRLLLLHKRQKELEGLVAQRTLELRESEHRAVEASQAKSVFLANMSHELRTPLNAVLGFARLLRRSPGITSTDREHLSIILRSGEHLLSLINQVLSISKIEAGKMTLDAEPFDLGDLVRTIERMFSARCEEAGIQFRVDVEGGLPPSVLGDAGKLRQILINLLGNAVKFTSRGTVSMRLRWGQDRAWFWVSDTGAGISEDELPSLFSPFTQTETGRKAKEGTGLGLAITHRIVELMQGTIAVESRKGEGTTFRFDVALPACDRLPVPEETPRVVRIAPGQEPPRIAVVDDTVENRALLSTLLSTVGVEVRTASNGQEGLSLWREWRPALIFMDVRMPVMDGREAIRRIREEEAAAESGSRTVLIAQTASVFESEANSLREAGADDVILKPYREDEVFEVVAARLGIVFEREGTAPPVLAAGGTKSPQPAGDGPSEVLSVEEDPATRPGEKLHGIDEARAMRRFAGNRRLLVQLVADFAAQHASTPDRLREALGRGDLEEMKHLAHTLRGSAATLSADGVAAAAAKLEFALRTGEIPAGLITVLETELGSCRAEIDPSRRDEGTESPGPEAPLVLILQELSARLAENNLEAETVFRRMKGALVAQGLGHLAAGLEARIASLEFDAAGEILGQVQEELRRRS